MKRLVTICLFVLCTSGPVPAQTPAPPGASPPMDRAPPPPPVPGSPAPPPPAAEQAAPATPPVASAPSGAAALPTLVPGPGDPVNVDDVTLPAKPAAVLSASSNWDDGYANLRASFKRIEEELAKAGLAPAGRPIAVFTTTDDLSFKYDAYVPIAAAPAGRASLTPDIRFGATPAGRAFRFVHKGAYDEIDSTYETITAYLDIKGIVAQDNFIEEYVNDAKDSADAELEINIFVQPK